MLQTSENHLQLTHPKYRPDIDGLRAIAVISVVVFHAFPEVMKGGFIGVDIFFVISGFLISTIIFQNLNEGTFSFAEFYARRVRRIFPALLIVLIGCYLFGWFVLYADEYKQLGRHMAGGAAFVSNFILWRESGYFDTSAETKPLLHLWSLGIEEQFYIVWPFLVWFAWKRKFSPLTLIVVIAGFSFLLNILQIGKDNVATFYSPQTRFWELLCGAWLAWIRLEQNRKGSIPPGKKGRFSRLIDRLPPDLLATSGFLLLLFGFWAIDEDIGFPGKWAAIPVVAAVLIIAAGHRSRINQILLSNRVSVWFGLISFPLYLWHWPLLTFLRITESATPPVAARLFAVLAAIFLAWLTYRLIEQPVRFGGSPRLKVRILAGLMLAVAIAGMHASATDGIKSRQKVRNDINGTAFEWPESKIRHPGCAEAVGTTLIPYCLKSASHAPAAALIGDSHANSIFDYFDGYFSRQGRGIIMLGKAGCPPFLMVERGQSACPEVMSEIVRYLAQNPDIRDVYITGRFAAAQSGRDFGEATKDDFYPMKLLSKPLEQDRGEIFRTGFSLMLDALEKSGKRITIVFDVPELDFEPKSCIRNQDNGQCFIERDKVLARQAAYREIVASLREKHAFGVADLMEPFCDKDKCIAQHEGRILYRDKHHLSSHGNAYLLNSGFHPD